MNYSKINSMQKCGLPVDERLNYALWAPQWKHPPTGAPLKIGACILGWNSGNGENPILTELRQMAANQTNTHFRHKYDRAIAFIEQNRRLLVDEIRQKTAMDDENDRGLPPRG